MLARILERENREPEPERTQNPPKKNQKWVFFTDRVMGGVSSSNIVVNKNSIPNDPRGVWETSGIRIGTAAMVTKMGNDKDYFRSIAFNINSVIKAVK